MSMPQSGKEYYEWVDEEPKENGFYVVETYSGFEKLYLFNGQWYWDNSMGDKFSSLGFKYLVKVDDDLLSENKAQKHQGTKDASP